MTVITIAEAGRLRMLAAGDGQVQRVDRPRHRRSSAAPSSAPRVVARLQHVRLSEPDPAGRLDFSGVASTTEQPYEMYDMFGPYSEVVSHGAFTQTLAQDGLDVPLVLGHDPLRRIARTVGGSLLLAETADGLQCDAQLDMSDPDVAYVVPKLRSGLLDEMSFMFKIDAGIWSPDYSEYRISQVDIQRGDVSIVGFGANPNTTASVRELQLRHRGKVRAAEMDDDPGAMMQGVDACLDQALLLFAAVDVSTLPPGVQQAVALVTAAAVSADACMEAMGLSDPDDMAEPVSAGASMANSKAPLGSRLRLSWLETVCAV